MIISYFDESGDDGYPQYSSRFFILSCAYLHDKDWQTTYEKIKDFRKYLKQRYDFPVKWEMHTRELIQDKNPYHGKYEHDTRREIVFDYAKMISQLPIQIISGVIDKFRIKRADYNVLNESLTYIIQRVENSIEKKGSSDQFMIITDEGRVSKMTSISRKIRVINRIPSFISGGYINKPIRNLIEDPLPKKSDESYFIQLADFISYFVYLYACKSQNPATEWPKRVQAVLMPEDEVKILNIIKEKFNTKAHDKNTYGILIYPK